MSHSIGDHVRMIVPDNLYVHGKLATIQSHTEYGAIVGWNGGSGQFRLLFSEMQAVITTGNICMKCGGSNMVRAGTCMLCRDCGDNSGGCG